MNPVFTLQPYLPKIHLNAISHLHLVPPNSVFVSDFPTNIFYSLLIFLCMLLDPYISSYWFYNPYNIWWTVQNMGPLIMQFNPVFCHIIPLTSEQFYFSISLPWFHKLIIKTPFHAAYDSWQVRSKYSPNLHVLEHSQSVFFH